MRIRAAVTLCTLGLGCGSGAPPATNTPMPAQQLQQQVARAWRVQIHGRARARDVAVDRVGNVVVAGSYQGVLTIGQHHYPGNASATAFVSVFDARGQPRWTRHVAGIGYSEVSGLAVDGFGSVVVAAEAYGPTELGDAPERTPYLLKLDASGQRVFAVPVTSLGTGMHLGVSGRGDIVLASSPEASGVRVSRFDPFGRPLGGRVFPGNVTVQGAVIDESGAATVVGAFQDRLDFDGVRLVPLPRSWGWTGFILRLDPSGRVAWARAIATSDVFPVGVALDAVGRAIVTGRCLGQIEIDGRRFRARSAGHTVFVAAFEPNAAVAYATLLDLAYGASISPWRVSTDGMGNAIVAGETSGGFEGLPGGAKGRSDVFALRIDRSGIPRGGRRIEVPGEGWMGSRVGGVAGDASAGIVMATNFGTSRSGSAPNAFVSLERWQP